MRLSRKQLILLGAAAAVAAILLAAFFFLGGKKVRPPEVALTVWGTGASGVMKPLFEAYQKIRPNVKVNYTQLSITNYEQRILEALAAGQGPDVFMVGNRDLVPNLNKLAAAPVGVFSLTELRALFPTVVEEDFAYQGAVYALPLSIDTLALIYNRDLFDAAALVNPPATWSEFVDDAGKLRVLDSRGNVARAGAALGGSSRTVEQAPDILQLLMFQSGVALRNPGSSPAARAALNFYLQFADAGSSVYTWNEAMPAAREAFLAGKVAMILDYRAALADLAKRSPFLRVGVASAPQAEGGTPVSFARYRGFAVSKWSKWAGDWAWRFVVDMATLPSLVQAHLAASGEPPALRSDIARALGTPDMDVFARQALTARSWQAPGDARAAAVFDGAIRSVLTGKTDSATALSRAGEEINQLLQGR